MSRTRPRSILALESAGLRNRQSGQGRLAMRASSCHPLPIDKKVLIKSRRRRPPEVWDLVSVEQERVAKQTVLRDDALVAMTIVQAAFESPKESTRAP